MTLLRKLEERLGSRPLEAIAVGENNVQLLIDANDLLETVGTLIEMGFTHLSTMAGVERGNRLEVKYFLQQHQVQPINHVTISCAIPANSITNRRVPSIAKLIPGAILYERECSEMFGIEFEGHPAMQKCFLPEFAPQDLHPLRKGRTWKETARRLDEEQEAYRADYQRGKSSNRRRLED